MTLRAAKANSLADQVFEQLVIKILTGEYAPGTNLPPERTLSDVFDVNRHVVREALKRLDQLGLLSILQGGGNQVLDYRDHAGLDLLALLAKPAAASPKAGMFWLAVLEMRANVAADLVRLCTLRASKTIKSELVTISEQMLKARSDQELYDLEVRFWRRVHDGADNIAYRLAFNSMLAAVNTLGDIVRSQSVLEVKHQGHRVVLAKLIAAGDADRAESTTRSAMRDGVEAMRKLFQKSSDAPVAAKSTAATKARRSTRTGKAASTKQARVR